MFKAEDILTRLQGGEAAEAIANEMVNALNDANYQFQEERRAKQKAADEKKAEKLMDLQVILDLLHDFCIEYYCEKNEDYDIVHDVFADLKAEQVNEILDELGKQVVQFVELEKKLNSFFSKIPGTNEKTPDDVINSFLRNIGL